LEELERLVGGHVEHLGDVLALVEHLERLAVVALAAADLAGDVDVGRKCISIWMMPSPPQASQRPPFDVEAEKRPGP
jgi:hypothetical protein